MNALNSFCTNPITIFNRWTQDIVSGLNHTAKPINIWLSSRAIVFAWDYAKLQALEIKNRVGNTFDYFAVIESVFINKIAEIAYARMVGYSEDAIFIGKSPVSLNYKGKDERVYIENASYYNGKYPILISGSKKYAYPIIKRRNSMSQAIIYVDASCKRTIDGAVSHIRIDDGKLKVTILGYVIPEDMNIYQDQKLLMGYSNAFTAFTGFRQLRILNEPSEKNQQQAFIPSYIRNIINDSANDIQEKILQIKKELMQESKEPTNTVIDYQKLFGKFV